jgi:Kef-type K+ transport system membrane component KefB
MDIILQILALFILAKLLGEAAEWLGHSSMIGEIMAGMVLGPFLLGWVEFTDALELFADLGIVSLLFISGAEMNLRSLSEGKRTSILTAMGGVSVPFLAGMFIGLAFDLGLERSLFLGIVLSVTSIGISVRSLIDLKRLNTREGYVIVGAAFFDDIVGIVLLGLLATLVIDPNGDLLGTLIPMSAGIAILLILITVGREPLLRLYDLTSRAHTHEMPYAAAIAIGLGVAVMTHLAGLHYALGAFVAGLVIGPHVRKDLKLLESLTDFSFGFMATFFFATVGVLFSISVADLMDPLILVVVVSAIGAKVLGGLLGSLEGLGDGTRAMVVGIGLAPRGEVALIIANIALVGGLIGADLYAAVTITVIVSIIFTPTALRKGFSLLDRKRSQFA